MTRFRRNRRLPKPQDVSAEGFTPTAYELDGKRVLDLPLKLTFKTPGAALETQPTTIAGALHHLAPSPQNDKSTSIQELLAHAVRAIIKTREEMWHAKDGEFMVGTAYDTAHGQIVITGQEFHRRVLTTLLGLGKDGIDPFETTWYWYESQSRSVETSEWIGHSFFVVQGDRIVREDVTFADDRDSAFRPGERGFTQSIFVRLDDHDSDGDDPRGLDTLESDAAWREAHDRFWYRKFYQDTRTGQLMVLRPDEPELYRFPEGRWRPDTAGAAHGRQLDQIRVALWVLLILAVLIVIAVWR